MCINLETDVAAIAALQVASSPEKAKASAWFFKTGPGQYGEGDQFIGITVPEQRKVARQFRALPLSEIAKLLASPIHEYRLTALFILVGRYQKAKKSAESEWPYVDFYLGHLESVNNWDLVDSSASYILGDWVVCHPEDRSIIIKLANSKSLWRERVAIIATAALIREKDLRLTLELAEKFLTHRHDLIHKATGWMLREVGKQDDGVLRQFLDKHAAAMPRTMLRYAIEKLSVVDRKQYLTKRQ